MKFYKLVNNNWVETGRINDYVYNIDALAYKLGYTRILSQTTRRATQNFYYIADCAKAQSPNAEYYFDERNSYLRRNGLNDETKYIYFSCSQSKLDGYNNNQLWMFYRLYRCEDCKQLVRTITKVGRNHMYCNDCVTKHATKCYCCGKWYMKKSSLTTYELAESDTPIHVCNHCKTAFERNLYTCADCGQLTRANYIVRSQHYCSTCYQRHDVVNLINGYHCGHMPIVKQYASTEPVQDTNFFGGTEIETECVGATEPKFVAFDINDIMNKDTQLCKFERDSSLRNGFEIITQPGTLDWYYETSAKFKALFDTLQASNCDYKNEYGRQTCGLHIHVNRNFFKDYDYENRLCYLFQRLKDKIRAFSQRVTFDYCGFAPGTTSWDNIYSQKLSHMQRTW